METKKSNLKKIVPPLDLCKQLPDGAFADSALVWERNVGLDLTEYSPVINTRKNALCQYVICPAPTLTEIMADIPCAIMDKEGKTFTIVAARDEKYHGVSDDAPATAALKLWLELNKEKNGN